MHAHTFSGDSLFSGCALIVAACLFGLRRLSPIGLMVARFAGLMGIGLVMVSATPLPLVFYAVWAAAVWTALFVLRRTDGSADRRLRRMTAIVVLLTALAAGWELRYRFPRAMFDRAATLYVIGEGSSMIVHPPDSPVWTRLLAQRHGVRVVDLSVRGATLAMGLEQAARLPDGPATVLLDIGGVDLMYMPAVLFAADLEALLRAAARPERQIAMFELPLPAFHNQFGDVQRRLCERFDVLLIPKHSVARAHPLSIWRIDAVNFTPKYQERMAALVMRWLGTAVARD